MFWPGKSRKSRWERALRKEASAQDWANAQVVVSSGRNDQAERSQ